MQRKLDKSNLWLYENCEFQSEVAEQKFRVILKSCNNKHAIVSNYYHRSNTYKIELKSFLANFKLIEELKPNDSSADS